MTPDPENDPEKTPRPEALPPRPPPPPGEPILQFFEFAHLPAHLQEISRPFGELAEWVVENLPRCAERAVALRKLLEGKDAAVRAKLMRL